MDYDRSSDLGARDVVCPVCEALVGEPCLWREPRNAGSTHTGRVDEAVRQHFAARDAVQDEDSRHVSTEG